ncbi:MAG TPA: universal stress protein [Thermodesulfobacteriota bacterium]
MRILFATDFSEGAAAARREVIRLARLLAAEVVVVHVLLDEPDYWDRRIDMVTRPPDATHLQLAEAKLESELRLVRGASGTAVRGLLRRGSPAEEIVRVAADERADLVVMGAHGAGFSGLVVIGSVAARVIRTAPCPVMTVPTPGPLRRPTRSELSRTPVGAPP